ncbi:hypothetical protein [Methanobacterium oryzae]|uniref:hypothetical protein n=1 Tax=Methanobacterium oryzae TaxID=69540 RepID=UPI003D22F1AE
MKEIDKEIDEDKLRQMLLEINKLQLSLWDFKELKKVLRNVYKFNKDGSGGGSRLDLFISIITFIQLK